MLVRAIGIVMGEVDQSSLGVPDVLAMHENVIADRERYPRTDVNVVGDEHGLRRVGEPDDEPLMRTRRSGVV
jgi:hypothetical protein